MMIESDQVAILKTEWEKLKANDSDAIARFKKEFNGMELYYHALSVSNPDDYIIVSARELHEVFLIDSLVIKT